MIMLKKIGDIIDMVELTMPCPKCRSTGEVSMPEHLSEVYTYVRWNGPCDAKEITSGLGIGGSPSRVINRLEDLRRIGMVKRRPVLAKSGRKYLYEVTDATDARSHP